MKAAEVGKSVSMGKGVDFAHAVQLSDDDIDGDTNVSQVSFCGAGSGTIIRSWLRKFLISAVLAIILVIASYIADASCRWSVRIGAPEKRCIILETPVGAWFRFFAFVTIINIVAQIIDRIVFTIIATYGNRFNNNALASQILFFSSSLEGSLHGFLWLGLIYAYFDGVIAQESGVVTDEGNFDPVLVERCLQILLAYQTLSVVRNLAVRIISRTFLISSFETRISDVLFGNLVIMCLTAPHPITDTFGTIYRKPDGAPTAGIPPPSAPTRSTTPPASPSSPSDMTTTAATPFRSFRIIGSNTQAQPVYEVYPGPSHSHSHTKQGALSRDVTETAHSSDASTPIGASSHGNASYGGNSHDFVEKYDTVIDAMEQKDNPSKDIPKAPEVSKTSGQKYDIMQRRFEIARAGSDLSVKLFRNENDVTPMVTLGQLLHSENWQHKLDFASTLRMRIFTKDARLVPLTRKEALPKIMKFSYMALSSLPEELLRSPEVVVPTHHAHAAAETANDRPLPPLLATDTSDYIPYYDRDGIMLDSPDGPIAAVNATGHSHTSQSHIGPSNPSASATPDTETSSAPGSSFAAITRRMRSLSLYPKANTPLLKSPTTSTAVDATPIIPPDSSDAVSLTMISPTLLGTPRTGPWTTSTTTPSATPVAAAMHGEQTREGQNTSPSLLQKASRTLARTHSQMASAASVVKQKIGNLTRDRSGSTDSNTPSVPSIASTPHTFVTTTPGTLSGMPPKAPAPQALPPSVTTIGTGAGIGTGIGSTGTDSPATMSQQPAIPPVPPKSRALHAHTFVPPNATEEEESLLKIQIPQRSASVTNASDTAPGAHAVSGATPVSSSTTPHASHPMGISLPPFATNVPATVGIGAPIVPLTSPMSLPPPPASPTPPLKRSNSLPRHRAESWFFTKEDAAQALFPIIQTPVMTAVSELDTPATPHTGIGGNTPNPTNNDTTHTALTTPVTATATPTAPGNEWSTTSPQIPIDSSQVSDSLAQVGTMAKIERFVRRNSDPQMDLSALHVTETPGTTNELPPLDTTQQGDTVPLATPANPLPSNRYHNMTPFELPISWQTLSDAHASSQPTHEGVSSTPVSASVTASTPVSNTASVPATSPSSATAPTANTPGTVPPAPDNDEEDGTGLPPNSWSARTVAAQMLLNGKSLGRIGGRKLRDAFLRTVRTANRSLDKLDELTKKEKKEKRRNAEREKEKEKEREKEKRRDYLTRTLRIEHFHTVLDTDIIDPERAFDLFDKDGDGYCTYEDFLSGALNIYTELVSLKRSLDGHQSVVTAVASVLNVIFWFVFSTIVLWIMQISFLDVYVPLGTILVSTSFAIGGSLANIVNSLIFILFMRPFDVGDRVAVSNLYAGDEMLLVTRIGVLQTTFLRLVNKEVTFPNWLILQGAIENYKRSPAAAVRLDTVLGFRTTRRQIVGLELRMNKYLSSLENRVNWRPTCFTRILKVTDAGIHLSFWATSHHTWHELPRIYPAIYALWLELLEAMKDLNIPFQKADQRLLLDSYEAKKFVTSSEYDPNRRKGDSDIPWDSEDSNHRMGSKYSSFSSFGTSFRKHHDDTSHTKSKFSSTRGVSFGKALDKSSTTDKGMNLLAALTNALQSLADGTQVNEVNTEHTSDTRSSLRRTARGSNPSRSSHTARRHRSHSHYHSDDSDHDSDSVNDSDGGARNVRRTRRGWSDKNHGDHSSSMDTDSSDQYRSSRRRDTQKRRHRDRYRQNDKEEDILRSVQRGSVPASALTLEQLRALANAVGRGDTHKKESYTTTNYPSNRRETSTYERRSNRSKRRDVDRDSSSDMEMDHDHADNKSRYRQRDNRKYKEPRQKGDTRRQGHPSVSDRPASLGLDIFDEDSRATPTTRSIWDNAASASDSDMHSSLSEDASTAPREMNNKTTVPVAIDELSEQQLRYFLKQKLRDKKSQKKEKQEGNALTVLLQQMQANREKKKEDESHSSATGIGVPPMERVSEHPKETSPKHVPPRDNNIPLSSILSQTDLHDLALASSRNFSKHSLAFSSSEEDEEEGYGPSPVNPERLVHPRIPSSRSFAPLGSIPRASAATDKDGTPVNSSSTDSLQPSQAPPRGQSHPSPRS